MTISKMTGWTVRTVRKVARLTDSDYMQGWREETKLPKAGRYYVPLWLKGLPLLISTKIVEGRIVGGKRRWANQTDSGQNKLGPSPERAKMRSQTYQGIAEAMADQWGKG